MKEFDKFIRLSSLVAGFDSAEDPRDIDYHKGILPTLQKKKSQGQIDSVNYLDGEGFINVRETYTHKTKMHGKIYDGFEILVQYYDIEGEIVDAASQELSVTYEQGADIQATQDRFQRNLYQLGSYIMGALNDVGFLSLFPMAHTQKALYIDATILPLIQFVNELEGPEYDPIMNAPLPNGKTVRQHSLDELMLDMALDYDAALVYIGR